MRIKFEQGMTPERIAQAFVDYVRKNELVIGTVNVYIQTFDGNMNSVKEDTNDHTVCSPSEFLKKEYANDVAKIRRSRLKAVNE